MVQPHQPVSEQEQNKNNSARVMKTAKLTFQGLYRYILYLIPDKAATAQG